MTNLPPVSHEVPLGRSAPSQAVVDMYSQLVETYESLRDEKHDEAELLRECAARLDDNAFFERYKACLESGVEPLDAARMLLKVDTPEGSYRYSRINNPGDHAVGWAVRRALSKPTDYAIDKDSEQVTFTTDHSDAPHDYSAAPENIARCIADIRTKRARVNNDFTESRESRVWIHGWTEAANFAEVIDGTAIYRSLAAEERYFDMYDRTMVPPFDMFAVCYENEHGNDIVMLNVVTDAEGDEGNISMRMRADSIGGDIREGFEPSENIDWDRVRWQILTTCWVGGESKTSGPIPTTGPVFIWHSFIYDDGSPADLRWIEVTGTWKEWEMAHLVLLETLNFLSCTNIEVVEPKRPRGQRRRMERESPGVRVKNLMVKPKRSQSARADVDFTTIGSVPLHTVRGHFSHYGACCPTHEPKGLLFGRITGKVFVPGHARGAKEHGEIEKTYIPQPENPLNPKDK